MRTRFRPNTIGLAALGALSLFATPSLLQLIDDPANAAASGQTVIMGPNGGRAICAESVATRFDKRVVIHLEGYENATPTPQRCNFRVPFAEDPAVLINSDPAASVDRTGVAFPASTTGPVDAWIILGGF